MDPQNGRKSVLDSRMALNRPIAGRFGSEFPPRASNSIISSVALNVTRSIRQGCLCRYGGKFQRGIAGPVYPPALALVKRQSFERVHDEGR